MESYAEFIAPGSRCVVEFGCGDGCTAEQFKRIQPDCRYIGVDPDRELLQRASLWAEQVFCSSAEVFDCSMLMGAAPDTLLYQGAELSRRFLTDGLKAHAALLPEGGQMVFVLDNIGYLPNILSIWRGKAPVSRAGVTLNELLEALKKAGLKLDKVVPKHAASDDEAKSLPETKALQDAMVAYCKQQHLGAKNDMWAKCYIVRAQKAGKAVEPLLVQTIIGEAAACARVRIYEPHSFCRTSYGFYSEELVGGIYLAHGKGFSRKVMIRQRMQYHSVKDIRDTLDAPRLGYAMIYELDDDPFIWKDDYARVGFADFICCHAIQVSTPALAEVMRQFNPNVVVFPNQLRYLPEERSYETDTPVTLFFGALNREREWSEIMPVLNEALRKYKGRLRVEVIFDHRFYDALETEDKAFIGAEYHLGFVPYEVYEQALHRADLALLPLHDTRMNRMKSDLKFIEAAGHGAVVLASPTVYADTVQDGCTGFIYHDAKEFRKYLFRLIEQPELRHSVARSAYQYVRRERLLSQHYEERVAFYRSLTEQLPQLNPALQERSLKLLEKLEQGKA